MSHLVTKPTKWHVRSANTQISPGIRPVWSESSLFAQWVAWANSEDSDQTGRMPRCPGWSEFSLGAHAILLVLSRGGSNLFYWCVLNFDSRPLITILTIYGNLHFCAEMIRYLIPFIICLPLNIHKRCLKVRKLWRKKRMSRKFIPKVVEVDLHFAWSR